MSDELKKEDYVEPTCLLNMDLKPKVEQIEINQVLDKLDLYYSRNDSDGALRLIKYWLDIARNNQDNSSMLVLLNELMGHYRNLDMHDEAIKIATDAINLINKIADFNVIEIGTTYLNIGTVYKASGNASKALEHYQMALDIYQHNLNHDDYKFAGLYNNMALTLVELNKLDQALDFYNRALSILNHLDKKHLGIPMTYLNMANLYEKKLGLLDANPIIDELLEKAMVVLDQAISETDGYYAFVCEKCSSTFSYYGYFLYAKKLKERAKIIYERD